MTVVKDVLRVFPCLSFEEREVFCDERGVHGQSFPQFRRVFFLEKGEESVPDPIPEESIGGIRRIGAERKVSCGKVIQNVCSRGIEERADQGAVLRSHSGESPQTGTAEEMEEECLCLVVFVVGGDDVSGDCFFADVFEESVSDIAKALFEIIFLCNFWMQEEEG